ncbi:MAG: complex I NDUFA9 subunit family protein [Gammaproteobacteria bacterium]|nr:complex I NDUFA9 subunit family protein [Gammaproteobacteria bacterium]
MSKRTVCILGGTGFVGRRLAALLAAAGHEVFVITRHRERHKNLLVLPTAHLVEGDIRNPALLRREFRGCDAVINLVGILNERGRSGRGFEQVHVDLPRTIVQACRDSGVQRLLHMSALGASLDAPSHYLRSKARGESLVMASEGDDLHVTAFRSSVIFGRGDNFTNRFVRLLHAAPLAFPLACPDARLQPVYVEDVASAFALALDDPRTYGQSYSLCGPHVYSLRQIVEYLAGLAGVRRRIIALGDGLSRLQASILEFVPGKPFSLDNYRSLRRDSICEGGFPVVFGITPSSLEDVAPLYLGVDPSRRYSRYRSPGRA